MNVPSLHFSLTRCIPSLSLTYSFQRALSLFLLSSLTLSPFNSLHPLFGPHPYASALLPHPAPRTRSTSAMASSWASCPHLSRQQLMRCARCLLSMVSSMATTSSTGEIEICGHAKLHNCRGVKYTAHLERHHCALVPELVSHAEVMYLYESSLLCHAVAYSCMRCHAVGAKKLTLDNLKAGLYWAGTTTTSAWLWPHPRAWWCRCCATWTR